MDYLPSLEERRQRIIENCCGADAGGDGFDMDSDPGFNSDTAVPTGLDKALNKIKKAKSKRGTK